VASVKNGLLEELARDELQQQKDRIGTYQIQARFALASIYDRAASGGGSVSTPSDEAESQGELELVTPENAPQDMPGEAAPQPEPAPAAPPPGGAP